jgi:hypothetical protein
MALSIENPNHLDLPPGAEEILRQMFADCGRLVIKQEFTSGLSGSRVFLVRPVRIQADEERAKLPLVVKFASRSLIEKEWRAYISEGIRETFQDIAEIRGEPVWSADGEQGGLCYPLLGGGTFEVVSLRTYCRQKGVEDIRFVMGRLMKILEQLAQHSHPKVDFQLQRSYDRLLLVNLKVEPGPLPPGVTPHLVKPDAPPSSPLKPGDYVRLEGFALIKRETATLNYPPTNEDLPPSYRVQFTSLAGVADDRLGQVLDPIEGKVTETRQSQLQREVLKALGQPVDPAAERLPLPDGGSLPNPLAALPGLLEGTHDVKVGEVHGDLNMENLLVDPQVRDVNLIDFSEARRDHSLYDFLRLEAEVMTKLVPELLHQHGLSPMPLISHLYLQLHWASLDPEGFTPHPPHPALEKPLAILQIIRHTARQSLFNINDFSEYYRVLALRLLGTLKFADLDKAEEAPLPKQVAFWGAAVAVGLYTGELEDVVPPCPYRGLEYFDVEHAAQFFGREELTARLLDKLSASLKPDADDMPRFLAIVGPSGSGKSSLARAGLLAALKNGALEGSAEWPVVIFRPGPDPLHSLTQAVGEALDLVHQLRQNRAALHVTVERILGDAPPERRLVVLVDQFEEVFTLCEDEGLRSALIDNLLYAANVPGGRTVVLLSLRADFYGQCAAYPELAYALSHHQELVGPMKDEDLRRAIERPAHQAGCVFEPGLAQMLLDDVAGQAGWLPLLQHALLELWGQQEKRRLTHAGYEAVGRVVGAVQKRAEEVYGAFSQDEQSVARQVLTRLVQVARPDEGAEDTRRRSVLADLSEPAWDVVRKLADARLLVTGRVEKTGDETVEMAHEALIRHWPRLRRWLDEDREFLLWRQRLGVMVEGWEASDQDEGALLRGKLLAEAEKWLAEHETELNQLEKLFIRESMAQQEQELKKTDEAEEKLRQEREKLEDERRMHEREIVLQKQQQKQWEQEQCRRDSQLRKDIKSIRPTGSSIGAGALFFWAIIALIAYLFIKNIPPDSSTVTSSTSTPVAPGVLFREDFSANSKGWNVSGISISKEFGDVVFKFVDGVYRTSVVSKRGGRLDILVPGLTARDFALSVDVTVVEASGPSIVGVAFRETDNAKYLVEFWSSGSFRVRLEQNGAWRTIQEGTSGDAIRLDKGIRNSFRVVVKGSSFTLIANDQELATVQDATLNNAGWVRLAIGVDPGQKLTLDFDNLLITEATTGEPTVDVSASATANARATSSPVPELTPTRLVPNGSFWDDFNSNANVWWVGKTSSEGGDYEAEIIEGRYRETLTSKQAVAWDSPVPNLFIKDFLLTVDTTILNTSATLDKTFVTITFRDNDKDTFYVADFGNGSWYRVGLQQGDRRTELQGQTHDDAIRLEPGVRNSLGIRAIGSNFTIYANGAVLTTLQDATLGEPGEIHLGLALSEANQSLMVDFDNVRVQPVSGKQAVAANPYTPTPISTSTPILKPTQPPLQYGVLKIEKGSDGTTKIQGRIQDLSGNPVSGVRVRVRYDDRFCTVSYPSGWGTYMDGSNYDIFLDEKAKYGEWLVAIVEGSANPEDKTCYPNLRLVSEEILLETEPSAGVIFVNWQKNW